jgi:hypothetical protein
VSAMRDMSRAIRMELQEYGPTLQSIPSEILNEYTEIVGAFFYDLVGEKERRGLVASRPSTVVAREMRNLNACLAAHHTPLTLEGDLAEPLEGMCPICARALESLDLGSAADPGLGSPDLDRLDGDRESARPE